MSTENGKQSSCSCYLCKPWKYAGNAGAGGDGYCGRRKPSEVRRAPGTTRSERSRLAMRDAEDSR